MDLDEAKEESPSKRMKMNDPPITGSGVRRRKGRKPVNRRNSQCDTATFPHTVILPAGILSGNATFELASAALCNILYMKQVIAYPSLRQVAASVEVDDSDDVAANGVSSLFSRRKRGSSQKSIQALLNAVEEFKSLCLSQEVKSFGVFFGPSHSVPKAAYTFDLPASSLKSSSSFTDVMECKIDSAVRALVRSMVVFWSGCGAVTAAPHTNVFLGAKLNDFRATSLNPDARFSSIVPAAFVYRQEYDQLISRKKNMRRYHFQLQSKQPPSNKEERPATSFSSPLRPPADSDGDWMLLKKPFKVLRK